MMEHITSKPSPITQLHPRKAAPTWVHTTITAGLLAAGILLRFAPNNDLDLIQSPLYDWPEMWPGLAAYGLAACLIFWERKRLGEYHLDQPALALFILARPLETLYLALLRDSDTGMAFPSPLSLSGWGVAALLAFALWRRRRYLPHLQKWSLIWPLIGLAVGLGASLLLGSLLSFDFLRENILFQPSVGRVAKQTFSVFIIFLGQQVVMDEVLFRGFLWGLLRQAGWKDGVIWLLQAVLAMVGSATLINSAPLTFWLVIPLTALVLGLLAWKSRSVAAGMLAHALMIGLVYWSAYMIAASQL